MGKVIVPYRAKIRPLGKLMTFFILSSSMLMVFNFTELHEPATTSAATQLFQLVVDSSISMMSVLLWMGSGVAVEAYP